MGRTKRSAKLDSRNARLKLPSEKRHQTMLGPGHYLAYRRPKNGGAGSWSARWKTTEPLDDKQEHLGTADDFEDANGSTVLSFTQAQKRAETWFKLLDRQKLLKEAGEEIPEGPYSVAHAMADYLAWSKGRGMKDLRGTTTTINLHILPKLGSVELGKLTRGRITKWHCDLAETPKRVRPAKLAKAPRFAPPPKTDNEKRARRDTANRILTILKAALNHAVNQGRFDGHTPWREVKPFPGTTGVRDRFLTIEEQVRLVNACPPDFRRLVQGALHTGARYGGLIHATVGDFDPSARTLAIRDSKNKSWKVDLVDEGVEFFSGLTAGKTAKEFLFTREGYENQSRKAERVIREWRKSEQAPFMAKACEAAGIDPVSFHELRHTYASILIRHGVKLIYVAANLGHSDTRMVERHYGHICPSAKSEAIRAGMPKLGINDPVKVSDLKISGTR